MQCLVAQSCLTLCDLMDCSLPGSSVPGDSPGKNTGVSCLALLQGIFPTQTSSIAGRFSTSWATREAQEYWSGEPIPSSGDLSNPGIKPRSSTLQVEYLPIEPPGKPRNTGMGSLSLLQEILPTQVSNWGLLHCRWILYQRSYHGFEKHSLKCIGISFLVDSQGLVHVQSSRKRLLLSNHLNKKGVIHIWKIILLGHILPVIKFTHFKEKNSMIFKVNLPSCASP